MRDGARREWRHVDVAHRDSVTELRFHSDGGPLIWDADAHRELTEAFEWAGLDRSTKVVILTGSGDTFCSRLDVASFRSAGLGWDEIWWEGRRLLNSLNEIDVPIISAVNGPATIHSEIPVMADIVLASEGAEFADHAHFMRDTVPGDGVNLVWSMLLGPSRAKYFLLTGSSIDAAEALRVGAVHEVLPSDALHDRARQLARELSTKSLPVLRYTKAALSIGPRRHFAEGLGHSLAVEGCGHWAEGGIND
jgi:enoyl-CoA hydratase/carnithine racemase